MEGGDREMEGEGRKTKRLTETRLLAYLALSRADQDVDGVDFVHFKLAFLVLFPAKT